MFYADQTALQTGNLAHPHIVAAKVFAMAQFASTLTTCRHAQLLAHLGAPLSSLQPCTNACDNCLFKDHWTELDVTATAGYIVDLFRSDPIREAGGAQNMEKIVNTLRGSQGEEVLPSKLQLGHIFGATRKVSKETVKTVFGLLLAHGVIRGIPIVVRGAQQWTQALRFAVSVSSHTFEINFLMKLAWNSST